MPPPTSVLLPTTRPSPVIETVAAQLTRADELLVICDGPSDPVTDQAEAVSNARLVVAGEPVDCSGKANAIAAGMAAAEHDRLVWTDDDFAHPPGWLSGLQTAYDQFGPVSELPFFVGTDPLSVLLEPIYAWGGTLGVYIGGKAWGGAVLFERGDLDEARFLWELRRTVSDDGLLSEHLDVTPLKRVRRVEIGGTIRETLERHVRFTKIVRWHAPLDGVVMGVITAVLAAACLLAPLIAATGLTLLAVVVYAFFDVRRWTALLAAPAVIVQAPLLAYAIARRTFVWGGRRYRWRGLFDVEVE